MGMTNWISLKDKYPVAWENVLISDGKRIGFGYFNYKEDGRKKINTHQGVEPTHWMPLPESPECT